MPAQNMRIKQNYQSEPSRLHTNTMVLTKQPHYTNKFLSEDNEINMHRISTEV